MINKTDLHKLIHKYYLNGLVERVKWNIKNNILEMDFMDDSAQVVGNLKAEEIEINDIEVGFVSTTRLLKLLAILNGDLHIDFLYTQDVAEKMTIDDAKFNVKYSVSAVESIPRVPKIQQYPEIDAEIYLSIEDIDSLLKAKGAIAESDEVSITADKTLDGEDMINFIFGDPNTPHSNKVTYGVRSKIINNFEDGTYFDSSLLKNILSVNKNCGEGLIKFSSQGMLHYVFNEGTFTTNYYMTSKENV